MDEYIISLQNDTVGEKDNFYFLGDFCFDRRRTEWYLQRLKGNLFFIKGNHDKKDTIKLYQKYGTYLGEQYSGLNINGTHIVLNHFAMSVWDRSHHGSWHLFGHSHGSYKPHGLSIDVGCMLHQYKPLEYEEIFDIMTTKRIEQLDHHRTR